MCNLNRAERPDNKLLSMSSSVNKTSVHTNSIRVAQYPSSCIPMIKSLGKKYQTSSRTDSKTKQKIYEFMRLF